MPGALEPISFPERTIPSVITRLSGAWGDKIALTFTETGVTFSYAQLECQVARSADVLARVGGGAGTVTAVLLDNCPELFLAWWGSAWAGGLTCMLNPELSGDQLRASLEIAAPSVVVTGAKRLVALAPILAAALAPARRCPAARSYFVPHECWSRRGHRGRPPTRCHRRSRLPAL